MNTKMKWIICLVIYLITGPCFAQSGMHGVKTIVLDAGHGGHDPGALGKISKEKDNALAIILKLGKYIETNYPDVKVIYTRKTDVFVELNERANIANRNNADLFISVHLNANDNHDAYGAATYCLGLHKTADNLEVEKRENSVIDLEADKSKYDVDPGSPEFQIQLELMQNAFLDQSISFADNVQDEFKNTIKRKSNGVKQAGFLVLWKTSMPAVLIETGFITNVEEEKFLASGDGQDYIAKSIFNAFSTYKKNMDARAKGLAYTPGGDSIASDSFKNTSTDNALVKKDVALYKVQLYAGSKSQTPKKDLYASFKTIDIEKVNENLYRYIAGNYATNDAAQKALSIAKEKGYKDAFVVAFVNGRKTNISEALKISGN